MYLRYIGENGSLGLAYGQIYRVTVDTQQGRVIVRWDSGYCPYTSLKAFMNNWEDLK